MHTGCEIHAASAPSMPGRCGRWYHMSPGPARRGFRVTQDHHDRRRNIRRRWGMSDNADEVTDLSKDEAQPLVNYGRPATPTGDVIVDGRSFPKRIITT